MIRLLRAASIREYLFALVHAVLMGAVGVLLFINYHSQHNLQDSMEINHIQVHAARAERLGVFLAECLRNLQRVTAEPSVEDIIRDVRENTFSYAESDRMLRNLRDTFARMVSQTTDDGLHFFDHMMLVDSRGRVLATDTAVMPKTGNAPHTPTPTAYAVDWSPDSNPELLQLYLPVLVDGSEAGRVVAWLRAAEAYHLLAQNVRPNMHTAEGLFKDHLLIYSPNAQSAEQAAMLAAYELRPGRTDFEPRGEYGFVHAHIPGTPFRYSVQCAMDEIRGPVSPTYQVLGILALAGMAVMGIAGVLTRREKTRIKAILQANEERLALTMEASTDAIWDWNPQTNATFYSPRWYAMLGMPAEETPDVHAPWSSFVLPEDLPKTDELLQMHLAGIIDSFEAEFRCMTKAGGWIWVFARAKVAKRSPAGKALRLIGTLSDITDRKRAELSLEETNRALEERVRDRTTMLLQAEKMASVGQLAAGIAHEINNPAGFVLGNLNTLQEYTTDILKIVHVQDTILNAKQLNIPPKILERIKALEQEIGFEYICGDIGSLLNESIDGMRRIARIVADLKDFSHVDREDTIADADINQLIEKSINVAWNELKYKCEIKRDFGSLPPVPCNGGKISQVILNLLVNAAQAIVEHGIITISTSAWGNVATIVVADNGPGIPEDLRTKIFDPFFTTKPVGQGTGLGLHICQKIITSHGGSISVDAAPGGGAAFSITLPIVRKTVTNEE